MQALWSIKAVIYDDKTILYPRVVGIYDPLPNGNQETINQIVSELSRNRVQFEKTCPAQPEPAAVKVGSPTKKRVAHKKPAARNKHPAPKKRSVPKKIDDLPNARGDL